ncbi:MULTISPECIES: hypothetical protein [Actinoalloteichus]|uniref:Uncharacterized protein n=1 Tax=Actinoalloteichus fjordicus TaxID=1612552 RepID=A0AAC9PUN3_9PSEU|nr:MULTISPECIES: hypothetical protein [Actinoalloteichus]APU17869.1 hypothetical protein UA74_29385 [Actinoalloteichus fjordicus]APU23947.1 hypothetical protein UA75_29915 [Actinoalloteichus sp. GBA129-24]
MSGARSVAAQWIVRCVRQPAFVSVSPAGRCLLVAGDRGDRPEVAAEITRSDARILLAALDGRQDISLAAMHYGEDRRVRVLHTAEVVELSIMDFRDLLGRWLLDSARVPELAESMRAALAEAMAS